MPIFFTIKKPTTRKLKSLKKCESRPAPVTLPWTYQWNRGRSLGCLHVDGCAWRSAHLTLPVGGLKITKSGSAAHPQNLGGFGVQSTELLGSASMVHGAMAAYVPTDRRTDGRLQRIKGARVHTHGQGRPRSPIRQRQCNSNCLQNTPKLLHHMLLLMLPLCHCRKCSTLVLNQIKKFSSPIICDTKISKMITLGRLKSILLY